MPNPFPYTTPPVLVNTSPQEGWNTSLSNSLVLFFDQRIFPGAGSIEIRRSADGSLFESIPITDASRVRFLKDKLVIDPAQDFEPAGHYYVTFSSGTLLNLAGLPFAGFASPTDFDFPIGGVGLSPWIYPGTEHPSGIPQSTDFVLNFAHDFAVGVGGLEIHKSSDGSLVERILVTDGSKTRIAGHTVFFDPAATLDPNTAYYVTIDAGAFIDANGAPSYGVSAPSVLTFTTGSTVDTTPPVVTGIHDNFSQTDNFTTQSSITIDFNEPIHGFGTVELHRSSDGALIQTEWFEAISVTALALHTSDLPMDGNTSYYVTLGPGSWLRDAAGNDFAGIAPGVLSFTTIDGFIDPQTTVITIQQPHIIVQPGTSKTNTNGAPIYDLGGLTNQYDLQFVLENFGHLIVNGPQDAEGVTEFREGTGAGVFENRGELTVTAGWSGLGSNASLTANWGTITVTSGSAGRRSPGIYNKAIGVTGALVNWGRVTVSSFDIPNAVDINDYADKPIKIVNESGATIEAIYIGTEIGGGIGINLKHDGDVFNAGTIRATGTTFACGIMAHDFLYGSIINTGSILATTTGTTNPLFHDWPIESYGIDLTGRLELSRQLIFNSGTITAQTAIITRHENTSPPSHGPKLDIQNTGQINGAIILEEGDDLIVNSGTISGQITLGGGNDVYDGRLGFLVGAVNGGSGDDTLYGGAGNDTLTDNGGTNTLDGGGGADTADFTNGYGFGAVIDLAAGTAHGTLGIEAVNTLISIESVITTYGNDVIDGSDTDNILTSNVGNDTLSGRGGNDTLLAGRGNDLLNGGTGDDNLNGGEGIDQVTYTASRAAYTITRNGNGTTTVSGPEGSDTVSTVERLEFADQTLVIGTAASFDFIGDGSSDILFQNTNGQLQMWFQNGLTTTQAEMVTSNPAASLKAKSAGDFNGDARSDILFQDTSGQVTIWFMNRYEPGEKLPVNAVAGTAWHLVGSGDFNSDLKSDIVLQHDNGQVAVWLMDGANLIGGDAINASAAGGWQVKASGDFDGDGNSDILFQHTNGQVAVWLMDGLAVISADAIHADAGTTWKVKATADLNGDGKSDILFQNTATSQIAVWLMNGIDLIGGDAINASAAGGWQLVGSGDLDGNGSSDILLQNTSGQIAGWMMSGLDVVGADAIGPNLGAAWKLISPTG